jgi:hypothetical protein
MRYYLLMRLFAGSLNLDDAQEKFDGRFRNQLRPELAALRLFGVTKADGATLRLTERGYYLWVMMMRDFFSSVSDLRDEMRQHIPDERAVIGDQPGT